MTTVMYLTAHVMASADTLARLPLANATTNSRPLALSLPFRPPPGAEHRHGGQRDRTSQLLQGRQPRGKDPMDPFHAFIECRSAVAAHRLSTEHQVSRAPHGKPCYTHENGALLLCDSCLAFWRECRENGDQTAWYLAVYLRNPSVPDKLAQGLAPRITKWPQNPRRV